MNKKQCVMHTSPIWSTLLRHFLYHFHWKIPPPSLASTNVFLWGWWSAREKTLVLKKQSPRWVGQETNQKIDALKIFGNTVLLVRVSHLERINMGENGWILCGFSQVVTRWCPGRRVQDRLTVDYLEAHEQCQTQKPKKTVILSRTHRGRSTFRIFKILSIHVDSQPSMLHNYFFPATYHHFPLGIRY